MNNKLFISIYIVYGHTLFGHFGYLKKIKIFFSIDFFKKKKRNFVKDHLMCISINLGSNWLSGFREVKNVKVYG